MIKSLRIRNFKCLRDVSVELDGFTVLIGKNDTGKTSLLEALFLLGALTRQDERVFGGAWSVPALLSADAANARIGWEVTIGATERNGLHGHVLYKLVLAPCDDGHSFAIEEEDLSAAGTTVGIEAPSNDPTNRSVVLVDGTFRRLAKKAKPTVTALSLARMDRELPTLRAVAQALTSTMKYQLDTSQLAPPSAQQPDQGERGPIWTAPPAPQRLWPGRGP